jgi:hypothetical protein
MSGPLKDVLFSAGFLGFALICFAIVMPAWFTGRIRSRTGSWVYKNETPGDYYFLTVLYTFVSAFLTLVGLVCVINTVRRALGI